MKHMVHFGKYLKEKREASGLTQAELAGRLGYSTPQFISNMERNRCLLPVNKVRSCAKFLKVDALEMFRVIQTARLTEMERKFQRGAR